MSEPTSIELEEAMETLRTRLAELRAENAKLRRLPWWHERLFLAIDEWLFLLGLLWLQWMRISSGPAQAVEWTTWCWVWGVTGGIMVYGIGYGTRILSAIGRIHRRGRQEHEALAALVDDVRQAGYHESLAIQESFQAALMALKGEKISTQRTPDSKGGE